MGANHHGFSCERWIGPCDRAHDVADLAADLREALDGVDAHAGQRTRPGLEVPVNRARGGFQVEAGAERLLQLRAFDPQHRYPVIIGLRVAQPAAVVGGVGLVRRVDHEQQHPRPLRAGHHGLLHEAGVLCECAAVERALAVVLLRLVHEDHDGLATHVETLVVVIVRRGRRDAVSGEYERQRCL